MSTSWPNPARPGVPLNPERDGWHWISSERRPAVPRRWLGGASDWKTRDPKPYRDKHWRYFGPCPTHEELAAMLREERARGMEDAEAVCAAAQALLGGTSDIMSRSATYECPAEYIATHEDNHAEDLDAALTKWKASKC